MNRIAQALHDEKLEALAAKYADEGFDVVKSPSKQDLPFDLGSYRPDLIASKGEVHLLIGIQSSSARISVDRLTSLAEEVSKHRGWRFLLVTLDDVDTKTVPTTEQELPTWGEMKAELDQVKLVLGHAAIRPALLYLWSIVEAALRRCALESHIPVERLPVDILLKHLYSRGEIPLDRIDTLETLFLRSKRIAHGANETVDEAFARQAVQACAECIDEWAAGVGCTITQPE